MAKIINPLAWNVPIVDPKTGYPTEYFKRILEDIAEAKIAASLIEALGGDPDEDQVVTWDDSVGDLAFKPASDVLDMIDDTHGAILYRDTDEWLALAPGTSGQFLKTNGAGADPAWAAVTGGVRGSMVKKAADQTAANYSAGVAVPWDTEVFDTDTVHDNVTNNTRLTVPSGITYVRLGGQLSLSSVAADVVISIDIRKNGSTSYDGMVQLKTSTNSTTPMLNVSSGPIPVVAGDYFEIFITTSDTSITVLSATSNFWMQILQ